jgi:pre-mRNA-splicing factor ISY1
MPTAVSSAADDGTEFVAYVPLPDTQDIKQRIVDKKKADLLAKYSSTTLQKNQDDAKAMLNKQV